MVESEPSAVSGQPASERGAQDELLLKAGSVLRRRYEEGDRHPELSPSAAAELRDKLAGIAASPHAVDGPEIEQAVALAHRLIDDDHPELSPMWPRTTK